MAFFGGCLSYPECKETRNQKPDADARLNGYLNSIIKYKSNFRWERVALAMDKDGDRGGRLSMF